MMIDVLHGSAYKINVILITMLSISKVLCDVAGELPAIGQSVHDFTECFIEHNVTEKDAFTAFRLHADELLKKKIPAWCAPCNSTILKYCLNEMLHDHCCCDSKHGKAFIDFFAKIGWAYELKSVSDKIIKSRVDRTGDGSHTTWGWGDKDQDTVEVKYAKITHQKAF